MLDLAMPWESGRMNFKKDGGHIKEIVVGGAKSYSYVTNNDKIVVKQKGITLDRANSNLFTFDKVKEMVLDGGELQSEKDINLYGIRQLRMLTPDTFPERLNLRLI